MSVEAARAALHTAARPEAVEIVQRYFKTGPGQYGEGDRFLGVRMPDVRAVARAHRELSLEDITTLLTSELHEERMLALIIMLAQYRRSRERAHRDRLFRLYLDHTRTINNWDLVDASAELVGLHLADGDTGLLDRLARSPLLWERRIAMMATFPWIRQGRFAEALRIAETLLHDEHDLIHKAVGWMLREIGQRDRDVEERFLREHAAVMPRTMLRYAVEKMEKDRRAEFMGVRKGRLKAG